MSLASKLAAEVRASAARLAESRRMLDAARDRIAEAMGLVQQNTDGTSDPRPGEAMMRFQAGIEQLDEAEQGITAAEEAERVRERRVWQAARSVSLLGEPCRPPASGDNAVHAGHPGEWKHPKPPLHRNWEGTER